MKLFLRTFLCAIALVGCSQALFFSHGQSRTYSLTASSTAGAASSASSAGNSNSRRGVHDMLGHVLNTKIQLLSVLRDSISRNKTMSQSSGSGLASLLSHPGVSKLISGIVSPLLSGAFAGGSSSKPLSSSSNSIDLDFDDLDKVDGPGVSVSNGDDSTSSFFDAGEDGTSSLGSDEPSFSVISDDKVSALDDSDEPSFATFSDDKVSAFDDSFSKDEMPSGYSYLPPSKRNSY
ncbi:CLUMA_CG010445, isoform A [Clunio marinus]|uniref:CLUMA_CG010445, isoform A n=1 Tax=Clunio marinus TaxID=568069 RepID=A0A1J1IBD8_9DIPT|nr:CLUMA_CG010445, isoform A [Clunio marinus]